MSFKTNICSTTLKSKKMAAVCYKSIEASSLLIL